MKRESGVTKSESGAVPAAVSPRVSRRPLATVPIYRDGKAVWKDKPEDLPATQFLAFGLKAKEQNYNKNSNF